MSGKKESKRTKKDFCEDIFDIDENIRFVGIVNRDGEVIEGGFKKGVEPLLDGNEEQEMYLQSLSNMTFFESFSKKFGPVDYLITKQKKITMMTFPVKKEILCISSSSESNLDKIRDQIIEQLLKNDDK